MYLPARFQSHDRALAIAVMRAEPFATLISVDDGGLPFATPRPLLVDTVDDFELRITRLQCAVKLNQHRPESHAALYARYRDGNADEQALAQWMQHLGLTGAGDSHVA